MKGFVLAGIKSGWLYTTSEKEEEYIIISEPTSKVSIVGLINLMIDSIKENKKTIYSNGNVSS